MSKRAAERRPSRIWAGVHCARCRWPVLLVCHHEATNDWRPRCLNVHCEHGRAARRWEAEPKWVALDG